MGDILLGSDPQLGIRPSGTRSREWYLGRRDPLALTAVREPSGRLTLLANCRKNVSLTWYAHPALDVCNSYRRLGTTSEVDMAAHNEIALDEGADVGYRWFAKTGERPLYALGHGLTYTSFDYSDLEISGGKTITATFTVIIIGDRDGADVPQLNLIQAAGDIL